MTNDKWQVIWIICHFKSFAEHWIAMIWSNGNGISWSNGGNGVENLMVIS